MSEIQETDKTMRILAMFGGVVAIIESILQFMDFEIIDYGFGIIDGVLGLIFAVIVIFLSIKPIHYTPVFLGILGILLLIFSILIGGIIVIFATFIGGIT
ncbi:MAG: hypothetical protein ACFFA0_01770 [Promethearchaeota archaeon]